LQPLESSRDDCNPREIPLHSCTNAVSARRIGLEPHQSRGTFVLWDRWAIEAAERMGLELHQSRGTLALSGGRSAASRATIAGTQAKSRRLLQGEHPLYSWRFSASSGCPKSTFTFKYRAQKLRAQLVYDFKIWGKGARRQKGLQALRLKGHNHLMASKRRERDSTVLSAIRIAMGNTRLKVSRRRQRGSHDLLSMRQEGAQPP
jgi:hypothetical protein